MKKTRKVLALLLVFAMLLSVGALAAEANKESTASVHVITASDKLLEIKTGDGITRVEFFEEGSTLTAVQYFNGTLQQRCVYDYRQPGIMKVTDYTQDGARKTNTTRTERIDVGTVRIITPATRSAVYEATANYMFYIVNSLVRKLGGQQTLASLNTDYTLYCTGSDNRSVTYTGTKYVINDTRGGSYFGDVFIEGYVEEDIGTNRLVWILADYFYVAYGYAFLGWTY